MQNINTPAKDLYNRPTPLPYLNMLMNLEYQQPTYIVDYYVHNRQRFFKYSRENPIRIIDYGCGYGVFGALLRKFGDMHELYDAVSKSEVDLKTLCIAGLETDEKIIGFDIADRALEFAEAVGFIDEGVCEDLTKSPPTARAKLLLQDTTVILETGAAYPEFIECLPAILSAVDPSHPPIIIMGPRGDTELGSAWEMLVEFGYCVRKVSAQPLRFRNFHSAQERLSVLSKIDRDTSFQPKIGDSQGYFFQLYECCPKILFDCGDSPQKPLRD